ncbi:MAG: hypothetical protein H7Y27_01835 [Gemmatimonadaceae bacterium]|nr:hypothetical protein [Chitinophagaceae bacterium]
MNFSNFYIPVPAIIYRVDKDGRLLARPGIRKFFFNKLPVTSGKVLVSDTVKRMQYDN